MDWQGFLVLAGGFGVGIGAGVLLTYAVSGRPLLSDFRSMLFDDSATTRELEERISLVDSCFNKEGIKSLP